MLLTVSTEQAKKQAYALRNQELYRKGSCDELVIKPELIISYSCQTTQVPQKVSTGLYKQDYL